MTPTNIAVCLAPSLFHLNTLKRDANAPRWAETADAAMLPLIYSVNTLLVSAHISVKDGNEFRMCDPHFHGYISLSSSYIILCCRCGVHSVCWYWFCWTEEQNNHNNSNTSPSLSSVTAHCLCDVSSGVYFPISAVLFMNPCVLEHITKGGCKNYPLETNKTHTVLTGFTLSFRSLHAGVYSRLKWRDHIPTAAIFLWCHTQGGELSCCAAAFRFAARINAGSRR